MIASSLRLIGVLASSEASTSDEANDALKVLNQMLSSWSTENLAVHEKVREEFTLTGGTSAYTWGTGGDFDSSRPVDVISAAFKISELETPIKILTTSEYADIRNKQISGLPGGVYFDGAQPLLGVTFIPVPTGSESAVFYSLKPFSTLTLNTALSYPPGYEKAIRYNLAIDLAPEYGRPLDAMIVQQAMDAKAQIKRKNMQTPLMKTDIPFGSRKKISFDFRTGE